MLNSQTTHDEQSLDLRLSVDGTTVDAVAEALRRALRAGLLLEGTRLPATRALARQVGVARATVVAAYAALAEEGFVEARRGSGTWVRHRPPPAAAAPTGGGGAAPAAGGPDPADRARIAFDPGVPDLTTFPRGAWARALGRAAREAPVGDLGHADPRGHPRLHAAVASYVGRTRGAAVEPACLQVVHGALHGVGVLARALRANGHEAIAVEDPGFPLWRPLLRSAGLEIVAVPVDADGLVVAALAATSARAVLVTPAHAFPAGVALSARRREELVTWAAAVDGLVVEDDYDGELRYDRRPVAALQALAPELVAYVGTASKLLAPAIRLAWIGLPARWRAAFARARAGVDVGCAPLDQLALADLLGSRTLDRHLRHARRVQSAKRAALLDALAAELPEATVGGIDAGFHALVRLPAGTDEALVVRRCAADGVRVHPLARFHRLPPPGPGLVLGFGALGEAQIREGVAAIGRAVRGG